MKRRRHYGSAQDRRDVLTRSARPPDLVLRYGDEPDQVADVHVPPPGAPLAAGSGPRAMFTMFFHGGFWHAEYGREHTRPLAEALAAAGFVVCAPEYRRSGQRGGGWPGTFDDVAAAVDRLPGLVSQATGGLVDERRYVLAGHSAGGHLALWAASRERLPAGSPWRVPGAGVAGAGGPAAGVAGAGVAGAGVAGAGVVALAAVSDLAACHRLGLGQDAAGALMGGGPAEVPERYAVADPARLLPAAGLSPAAGLVPEAGLGPAADRGPGAGPGAGPGPGANPGPVVLVHGDADDRVPCSMSVDYAARAQALGDERTECRVLPATEHFEVIDPLSEAWPAVVAAFMDAWHHHAGQHRAK